MTLDPVRFSRLKLIGRSPKHYQASYGPPTETMQVGTAVHARLLENTPFVVYDGVRRGKEWDRFKLDQPSGVMIFNDREGQQVSMMVESVQANPDAMRVLEGEREQVRLWKIGERECQGTPDVVSDKFVTELKTGETSDPLLFRYKLLRYQYHAQLAWYHDGLSDAERDCYIVAVENKSPYITTVFKLTPGSIEQGRKLYRLWWERLMACEAANEWPGYCQSIVDLDVGETELVFGDDE